MTVDPSVRRLRRPVACLCMSAGMSADCGAIALRLKICHKTLDLSNRDHLDAGKVFRLNPTFYVRLDGELFSRRNAA